MHPLWILLVGVVIVIGGVLVLRLHAFLALVLAALVVGALTPQAAIERYAIEKNAVKILSIDPDAGLLYLKLGPKQGVRPGMQYVAMRRATRGDVFEQIALLEIERLAEWEGDDGQLHKAAVASIDQRFSPEPLDETDLVIHPLALQAAQNFSSQGVGERVANAFGDTCAKIGILIAMAAIIGKCLLDSGAADKIVRSALRLFGERGAPLAFVNSGFLLGIPVFFDTVFYLMIPLGKALRMRTGRNYLIYVLTIVAGATMAHSLVPPTPGPLFVAEQLNVDLGLMIAAGCIVGLFTSSVGYLYASFANRRWELPLRESPDLSLKDLEALSQSDESRLPPLSLSLLPIVLPVALIAGNTVWESFPALGASLGYFARFGQIASSLGNKNIALVISAAVAMAILVWRKRTSLKDLAGSVQSALASGGAIILITAGGGAFGDILQQTGVAGLVRQLPHGSPLVIILLAFLITTAIRTAQGSATVAMITAVGVLQGMADQLACHPVYLALAIGCGSKPLAWMNDSGFWVICKMSGMTETEGLKYITPLTLLMGLAGLAATLVGAALLPLR